MLGDAPETGDGRGLVANPDVQIPKHIQRGEIVRIVLDNLAILFDRCRDLSQLEVSLGRTQSLYLIKRHVFETLGLENVLRARSGA
jgi:hypothetical protein